MFFDAILSNPYFVEGSLQSGNMTDIQEHCLGTNVSVPAETPWQAVTAPAMLWMQDRSTPVTMKFTI